MHLMTCTSSHLAWRLAWKKKKKKSGLIYFACYHSERAHSPKDPPFHFHSAHSLKESLPGAVDVCTLISIYQKRRKNKKKVCCGLIYFAYYHSQRAHSLKDQPLLFNSTHSLTHYLRPYSPKDPPLHFHSAHSLKESLARAVDVNTLISIIQKKEKAKKKLHPKCMERKKNKVHVYV